MKDTRFKIYDKGLIQQTIDFLYDFHEFSYASSKRNIESDAPTIIDEFLECVQGSPARASVIFPEVLRTLVTIDYTSSSTLRLCGILSVIIYCDYCDNDEEIKKEMKRKYPLFLPKFTTDDILLIIRFLARKNDTKAVLEMLEYVFHHQKKFFSYVITDAGFQYVIHKSDTESFLQKVLTKPWLKNSDFSGEHYTFEKWLIRIYTSQRKCKEALQIITSYYENEITDYEFFYYKARCHAQLMDKEEFLSQEWHEHRNIALSAIERGLLLIEQSADKDKNKSFAIRYQIMFSFEKAVLLSSHDIDNAYENIKHGYKAWQNNIETIRFDLRDMCNFDTLLWIVLKYIDSHTADIEDSNYDQIIKQICDSDDMSQFHHIYQEIFSFIKSDSYLNQNPNFRRDVSKQLLHFLIIVLEIRYLSKIRNPSNYHILYYTNLKNIKLLLADEKEDTKYRLPLFHAYHMNDPQEGSLLFKLLSLSQKPNANSNRFTYKSNYVFLKSFFSYKKETDKNVSEFLPMWVQYGDEAKGCCVVIDSTSFERCDLHKVTYIDEHGKCGDTNMQKCIDQLIERYHNLNRSLDQLDLLNRFSDNTDEAQFEYRLEQICKNCISLIVYLFKDKSYEHEQEVRILKTLSPADEDQFREIPGDIPKVYVYNDVPTYIDEIILGAKVPNPDDYVPYFTIHGEKMWKDYPEKQLKITHSSLQYR